MKKVVGIILVFCILLGSSSIYASGLPRTSLSKWYGQTLQDESGAVGIATTTNIKEVLVEIKLLLLESKDKFNSEVSSFLGTQITETTSNLGDFSNDTKNSLTESISNLEKVSFDEYMNDELLEEEIGQEIESLLADVLSN
ncbi:MAG: hypothetical protein WAM41_01720 [Psychrobacillus psychrotolerans]|uniref:hypothetical protein n=2 Tax=Psychrobacillus psychrotolerans TaxID=126156 RepID=UPI003BAE40EC